MKANELMVGDWVVINESHPDCPFIRKVDIGDLSFFTKFDPIPLTAEILEKNGWNELSWEDVKYHTGLTTAYKHNDYTIQIGYNESINMYDIFNGFVSFKTVHQLQHALRLCGLNDLADNFVI